MWFNSRTPIEGCPTCLKHDDKRRINFQIFKFYKRIKNTKKTSLSVGAVPIAWGLIVWDFSVFLTWDDVSQQPPRYQATTRYRRELLLCTDCRHHCCCWLFPFFFIFTFFFFFVFTVRPVKISSPLHHSKLYRLGYIASHPFLFNNNNRNGAIIIIFHQTFFFSSDFS